MPTPSAEPSRRVTSPRAWGWTVAVALLVAVPAGLYFASPNFALGSGHAAPGSAGIGVSALPPAASSAYDWPRIHQNALNTGYTNNTTLSTANASQLGVRWATELYGAAIDSPAVAYDSLLGETLVYIGTETGDLLAVNLANGQIVWGNWLGSPLVSSPVVSDGSVYVATQRNTAILNINATTGSIVCSAPSANTIEATAVVATPPGGVRTVYTGAEDSAVSGPIIAMNAATCAVEWKFTGYNQTTGPWDPIAYAIDAKGVPLVVFGTADPDSNVYALNAITGKEVWRFQTDNPSPGTYDVGAGATISPPGINGFTDGVAYVPNKYGVMAALDLTTGAEIWSTNFNKIAGVTEGGRSTAALVGTNIVFGYNGGLFDLNALNGKVVWQYQDPTDTEAISAPAIAGPTAAQAVVVTGDVGGGVDVVALSTGAQLYYYQTGDYITGSPAISDGNILIDSTDTLLYDFAVGGGNNAVRPSTTISSPAYLSTHANPNGNELVYGNASDPSAVAGVQVGIESGGPGGPWWNAATNGWVPGPVNNPAKLTSPGSKSTAWTFPFSVPSSGGVYTVTANAVSSSGQEDSLGAQTSFTILPSTSGPHLNANPAFVAPGGTTIINGGGFGRSEQVSISYHGTVLANENSTASGYLPNVPVTIPTSAGFGLSSLNASGTTTHKSTTVAISVLNSWDQSGYNASSTGYAPNDPTFYNLIQIGDGNFVHLAWDFVTGAPVNASPVVADDVVYVGNTVGELYAISVHNGGMLWTWSVPARASIQGLAVDPVAGFVFVTTATGNLYAISTATGLPVWSQSVGGALSEPGVAWDGVFVSSTNGVVERVHESTGALKWTVTLASSVTAAPAINSTGSILVVGELNGDVVALNASTGATKWTFVTGGPVKASATLWNGYVFVGSDDHYVYALSVITGAQVWKYKTAAAVEDSGALKGVGPAVPILAIGANNGELYALRATTGKVSFTVAPVTGQGAVVGVSAVQALIVIERAGGLISGCRNYEPLGTFHYQTRGTLTTTTAIDNNAIFTTAGDGDLYVFTPYAEAPI